MDLTAGAPTVTEHFVVATPIRPRSPATISPTQPYIQPRDRAAETTMPPTTTRHLPSHDLLVGAQTNLLEQQSQLSEARSIIRLDVLVSNTGTKQSDADDPESVQNLKKQLEEMRHDMEVLKREKKVQASGETVTPPERLAQIHQSYEANRNQYSYLFAGTWIDRDTPAQEHTIHDHQIINKHKGTTRQIIYLPEAIITAVDDTERYHQGKMQEAVLDKGGGTMTWFFPDAKSDSRMTTTKWHKKPDETQDEYQQKLKEVQRGKVAHETNMSSNQRPTSRPPTREQLPQGPAPKSSQEHSIQNTQRESSGTVGTPCDTVTRRPDAGTYSAQNDEAMRDVDMPQAAQPTQKVPEQTQSPPAETLERPPTITELQWGIMQILHKNP